MQADTDKYTMFYDHVSNDVSIKDPPNDMRSQFSLPHTASFILYVKTESSAKWNEDAKIFQETQFVDHGDFYRVELHEQTTGEHWAYFFHPNIYNDVIKIMVPKQ